jgi:hypothetical protein
LPLKIAEAEYILMNRAEQTGLRVGPGIEVCTKLMEAVDETLEMLGRKVKPQIYNHLEKRAGLKREEIPDKPEVFSKGLNDLFGSASKLIERNIAKRLYDKLGLRFEPRENCHIVDYLLTLET